ncbi:MAG: GNAT family N-acetyltransferase [Candidatus Wallbacteria bacterium]
MRKFIVLPDNSRVAIKKAELSDVKGILELYENVYSGKYTLPEATNAEIAESKIKDPHYLWLLATKSKKIIGSVIFEIEPEHRLGKIYGAAVLSEYQGKNIMHFMAREVIEELCDRLDQCDAIYATTRTVSFAPQIVLEHIGFVSLGVFPNVRRVQKHETHGLEVYFSKKAFEYRLVMPTIIPELKKVYKIVKDIFQLEEALMVDKLEDFPQEDSIWFIYDDNEKNVAEQFEKYKKSGEKMSGYVPFTTPNMRFYSKDLKNEIFCNINRQDGHMAVVGFKCRSKNFTNLLNSFCRAAQAVAGAQYVEILVSAFAPAIQKQALDARFLPCAYFPAMLRNSEGERIDYFVMSRSFVNLDFTELHLVKNNQKFLEAFMECWYNSVVKFSKSFDDETNIFNE